MGSLAFPTLDASISQFENSNPSYNNPMAVQGGAYANSYGAVGTAPNGLAIFQSGSQSLAAGDQLLQNYFNQGQNLSQAIQTYSGLPSGSPALANYTSSVSQQTGIGLNEIPAIENTSPQLSDVTSASYGTPAGIPGIPSPFNPSQAQQIAGVPSGGVAGWSTGGIGQGTTGAANPAIPSSTLSITNPLTSLQNWLSGATSGFSFGRIGLFLLALIVIAGGVFMFKPTQEVVGRVARAAAV